MLLILLQSEPDILNPIIYFVTVLFILSLITERATHFFKLNLDEVNTFFTGKDIKLRTKGEDEDEECKRHRNILALSVLVGTLVALFMKADIFSVFTSNGTTNKFGWESYHYDCSNKGKSIWEFVQIFFGCFLTGLFTSVGSKFWHDMLDLLLETKNLKRKLTDVDAFNNTDIVSFDAYLKLNDADIFSKLYAQYKEKIWQHVGVISTELRFINNKHTLLVKTSDGLLPGIGSSLSYEIAPGKSKTVLVKVEKGDEVKVHSKELFPSYKITNQNFQKTNYGSLGCFTRKIGNDEKLLLTCYHVVKDSTQTWEGYIDKFNNSGEVKWIDGNNEVAIGRIKEGRRDADIDAALVKLDEDFIPDNTLFEIDSISKIRLVDSADIENTTSVSMNGARSGLRAGKIVGYKGDVSLKYDDDSKHVLSQLIAIQSADGAPFSNGGDSGSIIYDEHSRSAIGILVAGNTSISYAMPIALVFDRLNITLLKTI